MCLTCQTSLDTETMDAFGESIVNILNQSSLGLMISIGYRTGLFEIMKAMPPSTSKQIADAAQLNERYVREWLGAMSVGSIVDVDANGKLFHLPASHAAMLTEGGDGECLAHLAQYIGLMGGVEDNIVKCFHNGGGVPYTAYPRFHEVMARDSGQSVIPALLEQILPLAPGLIMSLKNGIRVLDVGCGRGNALRLMAKEFPQSKFVGYDLSDEAIEYCRREVKNDGLDNIRFEKRDLTGFGSDAPTDTFDLITAFDAIHDQARPDNVLMGIRQALKPDGVFLMQDIGASSNIAENRDHPIGPLLYTISCMHCMTVSLAQPGGLGVGAMWGEQLTKEYLSKAGFSHVDRKTLDHDIQNYYYVVSG
jgi:SAM-dependent methyltransferase